MRINTVYFLALYNPLIILKKFCDKETNSGIDNNDQFPKAEVSLCSQLLKYRGQLNGKGDGILY